MHSNSIFRSLFFLVLITHSLIASSQSFDRPVPTGFFPYEFEQLDTSYSGYYFICPYKWGDFNFNVKMGMLDQDGYLVWWANPSYTAGDFKWLPNQDRFSFIGRKSGTDVEYYSMDTSFALVDSVSAQLPRLPDTHEFITLDNGNRLILTYEDTLMDLSGFSFNGSQGIVNEKVKGMGIQEFDLQGNLVWEWRSIHHIHPSEFIDNYLYNPSFFDYAHANSISQDVDGHLLVSFRHLDAVYKIDHNSGQVIWRLGGRSSDFTFSNDPEGFSGQHSARRLPNGRYGLFDNGNQKAQPRHTRVVEYGLDTITWTATLEFSYDAGDSIYASATGNYEFDQPGFRTIGWGNARMPKPMASLLDSSGQVVSQLYFPNSIVSYRIWAYELPFELTRPAITCLGASQGVTLSAPLGYSDYQWSTGEHTQQITVSDTGTYQVWVNKGIGMIGSQPWHITDISMSCGMVGRGETVSVQPKDDEVIGYFNLSGQPLRQPSRGEVHIIRYRSGLSKLSVIY